MVDVEMVMTLLVNIIAFTIGLAGNLQIVWVFFRDWSKKKSLASSEKILCLVAVSNICLACILTTDNIFFYTWRAFYFRHSGFVAFFTIQMFLFFCSLWLTAWLCVFYCMKVVNFGHPIFLRLKMRITYVVRWLLLVSVGASLVTSIPIGLSLLDGPHDMLNLSMINEIGSLTVSVNSNCVGVLNASVSINGIRCSHQSPINNETENTKRKISASETLYHNGTRRTGAAESFKRTNSSRGNGSLIYRFGNLGPLVVSILECSLPFSMVLLSCLLIIWSLFSHAKRMEKNPAGFQNHHVDSHRSAARTVVSLLLLYASFYLAAMAIISGLVPSSGAGNVLCYCTAVIYPAVHALILIVGSSKLKEASLKALQHVHCKLYTEDSPSETEGWKT